MRTDVLGVGYDDLTMPEAVSAALGLMQGRNGAYAVTPNPEIVMLAQENPLLRDAIEDASLVLADGIGVIYGARILGRPLKARLPGIDFADAVMGEMAKRSMSVFLLGAKPGVAEQAAERLMARHPGLVIAGTNDGYFKDDAPIIEKINAVSPDLLLVCLGAPKQELWMQKNAQRLSVGLMAGLGGALDVFAGNVQRAPERWQKLGLEWMYRLIKEPTRAKRMVKLPLFVLAVTGQRIKGR